LIPSQFSLLKLLPQKAEPGISCFSLIHRAGKLSAKTRHPAFALLDLTLALVYSRFHFQSIPPQYVDPFLTFLQQAFFPLQRLKQLV
jgi:hypothetical protein